MRYPERPLGDALALDLRAVTVEPSSTYRMAGVFSFGRGLFLRPTLRGSETKYTRFFRIEAGDLVLSRLKAFEGAVAIAPDELHGTCVSQEFPTFRVNGSVCDPRYLHHLCAWPEFWTRLAGSSKGMGSRRERVSAARLVETRVPLPDVDEQRRIATELDHAYKCTASLNLRVEHRKSLLDTLDRSLLDRCFAHIEASSTLGRHVQVIMGQSPPSSAYNDEAEGLPLQNGPADVIDGQLAPRRWTSLVTTVAREGDILLAVRATVGKTYDVTYECCVGRGFAVLRGKDDVDASFLRAWLEYARQPLLQGTHGSTFVSTTRAKVESLPWPDIPRKTQRAHVERLGKVRNRLYRANDLTERQRVLRVRIGKALLNAAFSGRL